MSEPTPLAPGLYLVATPIGTARDITLRALDILRAADVIAAEDTRTARKLLDIHAIPPGKRPFIAYHDHNGPQARPIVLRHLEEGRSVAYMSEAGTPLIADPGYVLVNAAREAGHSVTAAPGPSALITALSIGGLPTDRFLFAGFPPASGGARRSLLAEFSDTPATLVFYESPKRILKTLDDMITIYGPDRPARICRELTKKFEEVRSGTLRALRDGLTAQPVKGEVVLLVDRPVKGSNAEDLHAALADALKTMRTRDAADAVSAALGLPRRQVYQAALAMEKEGSK